MSEDIKKIHSVKYFVTPQDVDFTRQITSISLGNYILNTAGAAASLNNFGLEHLQEENLAWVVSRLAVEMDSYPAQYEKFTIKTWVENYGKLFTTRNFKIFDKNRSVIGRACSIWAVINLTTRKPYNLQNKLEWNRFATGIEAGIDKPIKIDEVNTDLESIATHTIAYSDIDFNQHTNSMKYLQWLADTFNLERFNLKRVARFDVNYIHEALFGDKVLIFREEQGNKTLCSIKDSENKSLCKIQLLWS
ncbi:MAG: acyl-[acyl-carrier-protein] thioesterase [Prevotellaceae bacterium]|jgi:acyl-ACP thioesterase|nr:acyl-[acyl-carrier-protein] thioesterase [Prevotellaceae bacterium]